jgi:DNA-binding transcriptional LysR family regulator
VVLKNRLEVGSNEAIKQTVAGGLGLAVLSTHTVVAELALGELALLDVQGFPLIRRWHVVYPRGKRLSAAALAFKNWLFEHRPGQEVDRATPTGATTPKAGPPAGRP